MKNTAKDTPPKEVTLTRVFNTPRSAVFNAWTDPRQIVHWWGPNEFTSSVVEFDARPGGAFRIDMRGPDGTVYPGTGAFREIVEPERLIVTTGAFPDESGTPQLKDITMVTFEDIGGRTKLTLRTVVTRSTPAMAEALSGMEEGWSQSLDRLDAYLRENQPTVTNA